MTYSPFVHVCYAKDKPCYSKLEEVLTCFMDHEDHSFGYKLQSQTISGNKVTVSKYKLTSQTWPVEKYQDMPSTVWHHRLDIYTPSRISSDKAFMYITGGRNTAEDGKETESFFEDNIDFAKIAESNGINVIVLYDIPNQFLFFNGQPLKEDPLVAYTYRKVMENPYANAYLAAHLPMAKAIIKAMDAAQEITKTSRFILSGASKRGWAAWLAALEDKRVSELVPVVIDINIQRLMNHTCKFYKNGCPEIYWKYYGDYLIKNLNSFQFRDLMEIEDPFSYWNVSKYENRFKIPMYVISASGDDFFPPDSPQFYFDTLQTRGHKLLRCLPNVPHYLNNKNLVLFNYDALEKALASYISLVLTGAKLPEVDWTFEPHAIDVKTSVKPSAVKLFTSTNESEKDFRCIESYEKWRLILKKALSYVPFTDQNSCDRKYIATGVAFSCEDDSTQCTIKVKVPTPQKGWQASFVELHYGDFVVTTEVLVSGATQPEKHPESEL